MEAARCLPSRAPRIFPAAPQIGSSPAGCCRSRAAPREGATTTRAGWARDTGAMARSYGPVPKESRPWPREQESRWPTWLRVALPCWHAGTRVRALADTYAAATAAEGDPGTRVAKRSGKHTRNKKAWTEGGGCSALAATAARAGQKERRGKQKVTPSCAQHGPTFAKRYPKALHLFFQQWC